VSLFEEVAVLRLSILSLDKSQTGQSCFSSNLSTTGLGDIVELKEYFCRPKRDFEISRRWGVLALDVR